MMRWIFTIMILISILFGTLNGTIDNVSNAAISECTNAVKLVLTLMGAMCLWSGVMRVAEKANLTEKISRLLFPITKRLFKGLDKGSAALKTISMNMTANVLGLGNAATPLGIQAMQQLEKDCKTPGVASDNMITLVVLNTASIQIIPTTIATLRLANGSKSPMEILPAILVSSLVSLIVSIIFTRLFSKIKKS